MPQRSQLLAAIAMLGLAAYLAFGFYSKNREREPLAYFYDLSERKLFTAPRDAVPPIAGTDGKTADGVRAVVFSPSGDCAKDREIAYLEKYSPELKAQFEAAKARPGDEFARLSRGAAQSHTFVARAAGTNWFPMDSEEAGRIIGEWRLAHPAGSPAICVP